MGLVARAVDPSILHVRNTMLHEMLLKIVRFELHPSDISNCMNLLGSDRNRVRLNQDFGDGTGKTVDGSKLALRC